MGAAVRHLPRKGTCGGLLGALLLASLGVVAACKGGCEPAVATCPSEGTPLTYGNFGRPFFATHCVRCHGGADTFGGVALTTVDAIRARRDQVYANAAGDNMSMPPGPDGPAVGERQDLAIWLACGAP